ncbi:hypothetical protein BJX70DRAFT_396680 [Aspergillus crustosus]
MLFDDNRTSTPSKLPMTRHQLGFWKPGQGKRVPGCSWAKARLDPDNQGREYGDGALDELVKKGAIGWPTRQAAQKTITEFLRWLKPKIQKALKAPYTGNEADVEFWFSLPAAWGERPRESILRAINDASYGQEKGEQVFWTTESEAAALWVFAQDALTLPPGTASTCLVVDCGGGTTDVTALSLENTGLRVNYRKISANSGIACGGAEVDSQILRTLKLDYADTFEHMLLSPEALTAAMEAVEALKFGFSGHETKLLQFVQVTRPIAPKALRDVPDKAVDGIVKQIHQAIVVDSQIIPRVVLLGGFSQSEYLRRQVESALPATSVLVPPSGHSYVPCPDLSPEYSTPIPNPGDDEARVHRLANSLVAEWILYKDVLPKNNAAPPVRICLLHREGESLFKAVLVLADERPGPPSAELDKDTKTVGIVPCSLNGVTEDQGCVLQVGGHRSVLYIVIVLWDIVAMDKGFMGLHLNLHVGECHIRTAKIPITSDPAHHEP